MRLDGARGLDGPLARPRIAGFSTSNDDLIIFIRRVPPIAPDRQPMIPRNIVHPDQFGRILGEHGNVESAYNSTAYDLLVPLRAAISKPRNVLSSPLLTAN